MTGDSRPAEGGDGAAHLLIFEPDGRGHAREWIGHLLDWRDANAPDAAVTVATDPTLARMLSRTGNLAASDRISVRALTPLEHRLCTSARLAVSGLARWWTLHRHMRASGARHGLLLSIDHLTLPLGLGFPAKRATLSGILFRPSVHYPAAGNRPWRDRLRDLRKTILYGGMLKNPAVHTVWSLDPDFPAFAAARFHRGDKVMPLPDPVCPPSAGVPIAGTEKPDGRTRFLLFGVLAERKGVFQLLQALERLSPDDARAVRVVFAGVLDESIAARFVSAVESLRTRQPDLQIVVDARRLPTPDLAAAIANADVVLAPYQRFVGSSGVLLWAAGAGKPVITQSYGLLGRQVAAFGLGLAVDTTRPDELAAALVATLRDGAAGIADPAGMTRFASNRTPAMFAGRVLRTAFDLPAHGAEEDRVAATPLASTD